ncbi:MAG: hydantoinase/oxoprolinase N-terminal domain-containing protein, partial [Giesbergeria sp.]
MRNIAIGVDIGGTFTDIVAIDYRDGSVQARKVLTTHRDPTQGVISGLEFLFHETHIVAGDIMRLVHATTLFANALIENKGVLTGLLTTQGFRDVIEIGRERRYDLYDVNIEAAVPLVPRHLRVEIAGRMDAAGTQIEPLDRQDVRQAVQRLTTAGIRSLAVCLLHSYANDLQERQVKAWIREDFPQLSVSLSCEISPEIREFDRLCT